MFGERPWSRARFAGLTSAQAFPALTGVGLPRRALGKGGVVGGEEEAGRAAFLGTLVPLLSGTSLPSWGRPPARPWTPCC